MKRRRVSLPLPRAEEKSPPGVSFNTIAVPIRSDQLDGGISVSGFTSWVISTEDLRPHRPHRRSVRIQWLSAGGQVRPSDTAVRIVRYRPR